MMVHYTMMNLKKSTQTQRNTHWNSFRKWRLEKLRKNLWSNSKKK